MHYLAEQREKDRLFLFVQGFKDQSGRCIAQSMKMKRREILFQRPERHHGSASHQS